VNRFALLHSSPVSALHTKQLPTFNVFFDDTLTDFDLDISPWKKPGEWVVAESEYVNSVVRGVAELTENGEINQARFSEQLIPFPVSCDCLNALDT
jgi:hypothetical protein